MATFIPTAEWQDVPEGAVVPPGCVTKMDLETGREQARLDVPPATNGPDRTFDFDAAYEQRGEAKPTPDHIPYTLLCDIRPNLECDDIVSGLIRRRAFGEFHSESSGGKTAILVDLALHIAAGLEYRTRRVEQQPVVYAAFEGHGGIDNRVYAAKEELGILDAPFALVKITTSFKDPAVVRKIADIAGRLMRNFGGDCPVIIVDTYQAALGAGTSDCDPKDVTAFIANVKQFLLIACTVIIAHHFGKDTSRGGRGWSGLRAALDFELEIDRDDDLRIMRLTKSRDDSDHQPAFCYRFHGREVGKNKHNEPVTAVVVEHLKDQDVSKTKRVTSSIARSALQRLWDCIKDRKRSFPLPDDRRYRCVLLPDWELACKPVGAISKSKEERDRLKQFRKAKDELEDAGLIICDGDDGARVRPAQSGKNGRGEDFV